MADDGNAPIPGGNELERTVIAVSIAVILFCALALTIHKLSATPATNTAPVAEVIAPAPAAPTPTPAAAPAEPTPADGGVAPGATVGPPVPPYPRPYIPGNGDNPHHPPDGYWDK